MQAFWGGKTQTSSPHIAAGSSYNSPQPMTGDSPSIETVNNDDAAADNNSGGTTIIFPDDYKNHK